MEPTYAQKRATLVEPVQVPILRDGKQIGTGRANAGVAVEILSESGNFIEIQTSLGRTQTKASNLSILKDDLPESKSLQLDKQPIQSKPLIQTPVLRPDSGMVIVEGGKLPKTSKLSCVEVATFQIGIDEVGVEEWEEIRKYAVKNGYDDLQPRNERYLSNEKKNMKTNPSMCITWYEAVKWCNAKSEKSGFEPVYYVDGAVFKSGDFGGRQSALHRMREHENPDEPIKDANFVEIKKTANGYRLPTEAEWEWAARGGRLSKGYIYSGSNNIEDVGWFATNYEKWWNDKREIMEKTGKQPFIEKKKPNELGIFNMSGLAREWCEDLVGNFAARCLKGGGIDSSEEDCAIDYQHAQYPFDASTSSGLRLARSSGNRSVATSSQTDLNAVAKRKVVEINNDEDPIIRTSQAFSPLPKTSTGASVPFSQELISRADAGDIPAAYYVGKAYEEGNGIVADRKKAALYYRKSARYHEDYVGIFALCDKYAPKAEEEKLRYYLERASRGDSLALNYIGFLYVSDNSDLRQREGVEMLRKSADMGFAIAQFNLAYCLHKVKGIEKNVALAIEYYEKAAGNNLREAALNLGYMYQRGEGVPKDTSKAYDWFKLSSERGYNLAARALGDLCLEGSDSDSRLDEAIWWYRKAASWRVDLAISQQLSSNQ